MVAGRAVEHDAALSRGLHAGDHLGQGRLSAAGLPHDGQRPRARPKRLLSGLLRCGKCGGGWSIVGGESGPGARPMHPDWARSLRDQCQTAGAAFHFKQWGEWTFPGQSPGTPASDAIRWLREDGLLADQPMSAIALGGMDGDPGEKRMMGGEEVTVYMSHRWTRTARVGKARAGRLLDGREWNEVPHG